ncbi:MAG: YceI family protein [Candidatus Pedobacter colombiensis]|uniref:YceI family protein n=1 Tax=Candidatus Pedobacter colombiensis TaxID=3121371 RepID=A0AAJ6BA64_9SPHI|nr:YceI family protein [Pedobacter sp.]WEK20943.1 MAG: YceI family protein [Pedobacter sp.]
MKKIYAILVIALLATNLSFGQTILKADPMHSKLTFTVEHFGISDVFGLFQKFDVTVTSSKPDFSDAVFELSTDLASINTEVKMRDDDLRSPHFFDVEKYPLMTFKSTSIKKDGKDRYKLTGNLTMHGVTKPVTMDLWYRGTMLDQMSKKQRYGFQLAGTLNRYDFNIGPSYPEIAISNLVRIKADGEFIK